MHPMYTKKLKLLMIIYKTEYIISGLCHIMQHLVMIKQKSEIRCSFFNDLSGFCDDRSIAYAVTNLQSAFFHLQKSNQI